MLALLPTTKPSNLLIDKDLSTSGFPKILFAKEYNFDLFDEAKNVKHTNRQMLLWLNSKKIETPKQGAIYISYCANQTINKQPFTYLCDSPDGEGLVCIEIDNRLITTTITVFKDAYEIIASNIDGIGLKISDNDISYIVKYFNNKSVLPFGGLLEEWVYTHDHQEIKVGSIVHCLYAEGKSYDAGGGLVIIDDIKKDDCGRNCYYSKGECIFAQYYIGDNMRTKKPKIAHKKTLKLTNNKEVCIEWVKDWDKTTKIGVRITPQGLPNFDYEKTYGNIKKSMIKEVVPASPSFSGSIWRVFDTIEQANAWVDYARKIINDIANKKEEDGYKDLIEIDVIKLLNFVSNSKTLCFSSSEQNKQLYRTLTGNYEVWHNDQLISCGVQANAIVEIYNAIK